MELWNRSTYGPATINMKLFPLEHALFILPTIIQPFHGAVVGSRCRCSLFGPSLAVAVAKIAAAAAMQAISMARHRCTFHSSTNNIRQSDRLRAMSVAVGSNITAFGVCWPGNIMGSGGNPKLHWSGY